MKSKPRGRITTVANAIVGKRPSTCKRGKEFLVSGTVYLYICVYMHIDKYIQIVQLAFDPLHQRIVFFKKKLWKMHSPNVLHLQHNMRHATLPSPLCKFLKLSGNWSKPLFKMYINKKNINIFLVGKHMTCSSMCIQYTNIPNTPLKLFQYWTSNFFRKKIKSPCETSVIGLATHFTRF